MSSISAAVSRASGALVATAPRRVAAWAAVATALVAVTAARAVYGLVGVGVSQGTAAALDVLSVAALVAVYALAGRRVRPADPVRSLYRLVAASTALLATEWALGTLATGRLLPGGIASSATVVAAGAVVGVAEGVLAVAIAIALRPLVLYRRGRMTLAVWRLALVAAVIAGLGWAGAPADAPPDGPRAVLDLGATLIALALVLRQRWVTVTTGRRRLGAAVLAWSLAAALIGVIAMRVVGPAGLETAGGFQSVPLASVLSRSLANLSGMAFALGALYGLTAGLVLVFQLPAAAPTRAGERRAFQSLASLSGGLLDRGALVDAVARGPVEAGLADAAWLLLAHPDGAPGFDVVAQETITATDARDSIDGAALVRASAEAARTEAGPLVLGRAEADHRVHARPGSGLGSLVVLPLLALDAAGLPRGALVAARRTPDGFEEDDVAALDAFAAQAALSLSHADLIAGALERERMARELSLAREVQLRLFPQSLPDIAGLDIAAAERSALEVGGDYYDAVALGETCAGIVVADVSGKGTAAAFHMAEMKGIFQAGARLTRAPAELLCRASEALAPSLGAGTFVSTAYAVVDAEAGTLSVARAGHCPPVLARDPDLPDGGARLLRSRGVAIGLGSTDLFARTLDEERLDLRPGDALVLYTDGLVEARDASGEEWGYTRLLDTVAAHRTGSAQALLDALLAAHHDWSATPDAPADDVTLVVMTWSG